MTSESWPPEAMPRADGWSQRSGRQKSGPPTSHGAGPAPPARRRLNCCAGRLLTPRWGCWPAVRVVVSVASWRRGDVRSRLGRLLGAQSRAERQLPPGGGYHPRSARSTSRAAVVPAGEREKDLAGRLLAVAALRTCGRQVVPAKQLRGRAPRCVAADGHEGASTREKSPRPASEAWPPPMPCCGPTDGLGGAGVHQKSDPPTSDARLSARAPRDGRAGGLGGTRCAREVGPADFR